MKDRNTFSADVRTSHEGSSVTATHAVIGKHDANQTESLHAAPLKAAASHARQSVFQAVQTGGIVVGALFAEAFSSVALHAHGGHRLDLTSLVGDFEVMS